MSNALYITNLGGWYNKKKKAEIHIEINGGPVIVLDESHIDYLRPWLEEYYENNPSLWCQGCYLPGYHLVSDHDA